MDTNFNSDHVNEPSVTKRRSTNHDIFTHQSANKTFVPTDPSNDFLHTYCSDKDILAHNDQFRVPSHDGSYIASDEDPILNEPELDMGRRHRIRPGYSDYNIYEDAPQVVENYSLYNTSASSLNEGEFEMECLDDREEVFDSISVEDAPALEEVNNLVYPSPQSGLIQFQQNSHYLSSIPNEITAQGAYDWYINDWQGVKDIPKLHSDSFQIGDYRWRLLIFPQGNQSGVVQSMSIFLENEDCKSKAISVCAQFSLAIISTLDPEVAYAKESHHRFIDPTSDWGFAKFIRLDELEKSSSDLAPQSSLTSAAYQKLGTLLNDNRFIIRTHVRIVHDPIGNLWIDPSSYDSRRETGYVGIKNQGATCYMNSLLQSLFVMTAFQRSTFQIPTDVDEDQMARNIPLALQKFFYQLHVSPGAVSTKDLTRSFGWDSYESFLQQDIQELKAVLFDALEAKLKGTSGEHDLDKLFQIRSVRLTKCLHVDYESKSGSTCYDLPLEIKGLPNIQASFEKYIEKETFEGNNQYKAEHHGYQDAVTGNIFTRFPPVLYLNLKRYDYDPMLDRISKINDYYEFPETLDLTPYYDPSVDAEPEKAGDPKQKQIFHLLGVLVHAGDFGGGHYYAFLRDLAKKEKGGSKWMRFDDDRVYFASEEEAIQENFGDGNITNTGNVSAQDPRLQTRSDNLRKESNKPHLSSLAARLKRVTSAYMLIYVREEDIPWVLAPFSVSDIPSKLSSMCEQERQDEIDRRAARLREQAQQKLFIITESMLTSNHGQDLFDHLFASSQEKLLSKKINETAKTITPSVEEAVTPPELYMTTVLKSASIKDLKYHLQAEHGIAVEDQRLWLVTRKTAGSADGRRVGMLLDDRMPITKVTDRSGSLTIYLEIATPDSPLAKLKEDSILIFLKLYDPRISKLTFIGTFTLTSEERLSRDVVPKIRRKLGLPDNSPLLLFEEINRDKVKQFSPQEMEKTISAAVIQHGNILIAQPQMDTSSISAVHSVDDLSITPILPTTIQYFAWLSKRLVLTMMLYQSSDFNSNLHEVLALQEKEKINSSISGKAETNDQSTIDPPGTFYLQVSRDMTYATLSQMLYVALVGAYGNSVIPSPEHLRFRGYDGILDAAKSVPFLHSPDVPLDELLSKTLYMQPTHRLYYEILDISLPLFQLKKPLRVSFLNQVSPCRSPMEMSPSSNPSLALTNSSHDSQSSNSPNLLVPATSPVASPATAQSITNVLDSRVILVDDHDKLEHLLEKLHLKVDLSNLYINPSEDTLLAKSLSNPSQHLQREYSEMNLEPVVKNTPQVRNDAEFRLLEIHPTHLWNIVGCYHEQDIVGHDAKDTDLFLLDRVPFEQQSEQLSNSGNLLVRVVHYHKDLRHSHALPSLFLIKPLESFAAMKARLRQHLATVLPTNLGVFTDKDWGRIQFTFASTMQPISPITEDDFNVQIGSTQPSAQPFFNWFQSSDLKTDFLGLDYPSKLSSGKNAASSTSPYEKGLKIHS